MENLSTLVVEKIEFGEELIESTKKYDKLDGIQKLQRKIKQELNFFKKIHKTQCIKKEHLQCSNLTHFSALVNTLKSTEKCTSVNKAFMLNERKFTVDIVCDNGLTWMKVVARNPKSLNQICLGDTSFGVRSVIDQAQEYLDCSKLYPYCFQTPKIIFVFSNGIGSNLAARLESLGIIVQGERLLIENDNWNEIAATNLEDEAFKSDLSTLNTEKISKINFDVSAMLAYVSSVTNGSANLYKFPAGVLAQQAEWERQRPQKPIIDKFIKGKKLYCCETARDNFINIINTVGGTNEKIRAGDFLKRIAVLRDDATAQDVSHDNDDEEIFKNVQLMDKSLLVGGKIKQRSLVIFSFGDRIQAVTVTANDGFVRAARQQGINFVVFVHESRALTEQKERVKGTACQDL